VRSLLADLDAAEREQLVEELSTAIFRGDFGASNVSSDAAHPGTSDTNDDAAPQGTSSVQHRSAFLRGLTLEKIT
jgi:hypothetical protein